MFDPYSVKEGAKVDLTGIGPMALEDCIRKLRRRGLKIDGNVVVRDPSLDEFIRAEESIHRR